MSHSRYPKEIILKDCSEVILRTVEPEDRDALAEFYQGLEKEFRWYFKEDPCDLDVIDKWNCRIAEGKSFFIVACSGERIVAHAGLLLRPYGARQHIGRLRITVSRDFRYKQLGTWMIFDLIKRAMEMKLERIRIDFVKDVDDMAIHAVRKLDFVQEGLLKDYIRDEQGGYHDYIIMVKQLHRDWSDF